MTLGSLMSCCLCTGLAGGAGPAQLIPEAAKAGRWLWRSCPCWLTLLCKIKIPGIGDFIHFLNKLTLHCCFCAHKIIFYIIFGDKPPALLTPDCPCTLGLPVSFFPQLFQPPCPCVSRVFPAFPAPCPCVSKVSPHL